MVNYKAAIIGACAVVALAAAPIAPASARWHHHGGLIFGLAAGAAVTAAAIATAPLRVLAGPPVYAPYAPYAPAPSYYAPPPAYYAPPPPPAYYAPAPGYYAPYYGR